MFSVGAPETLVNLINNLGLYEVGVAPMILADPKRGEAIIWLLKDALTEDQYRILEASYSSEETTSTADLMQIMPEYSASDIRRNLAEALEILASSPVKDELYTLAYVKDVKHVENDIKFAMTQGIAAIKALDILTGQLLALNYFSTIPGLEKVAKKTVKLGKLWEKMANKTLGAEDEVLFDVINMEKFDEMDFSLDEKLAKT